MTWRERIQAARERGRFTAQDYVDVLDYRTCMVGEVASGVWGEEWQVLSIADCLKRLGLNKNQGHPPLFSVRSDDFVAAEQALDFIEDRVLQLKREWTNARA